MAEKQVGLALVLAVSLEKRISAMKLRNLVFVLGIAWLVSQCQLASRAENITAPLVHCDERLFWDLKGNPRDGHACGNGHLTSKDGAETVESHV